MNSLFLLLGFYSDLRPSRRLQNATVFASRLARQNRPKMPRENQLASPLVAR